MTRGLYYLLTRLFIAAVRVDVVYVTLLHRSILFVTHRFVSSLYSRGSLVLLALAALASQVQAAANLLTPPPAAAAVVVGPAGVAALSLGAAGAVCQR